MIFMLAAWLWMATLSLGLGGALFRMVRPPDTLGIGAGFFLSLWLGLFSWATVFLAFCAVTPLRPWLGWASLVISAALFALPNHPARAWLSRLRSDRAWITGLAVIPLLLLPVCVQPVTNTDSVSYHYDIIAWMSRIGTVPGLALIHARFAFISIWFTFPAILNDGLLEARMTGVANGFAAVAAAGQIFWALVCFLRGSRSRIHTFAGAALFLTIVFPTLLNIPAAPPHDYPVGIVIVLTAWTLLLTESSHRGPWRYLPILFASFAITLKLSSLPVLAATGLIGLWRQPDKWRFFLTSAAVGCALILPWIINQILLSGWPLFPLGFSLPFSWAVSTEEATRMVNRIRQYAPWPILETGGPADVLKFWLTFDRTHPPALLYMGAALISAMGLLIRRNKLPIKPAPLLLLGGLGSLFWLYTTAHPRFGWGYLSLLPAALVFLIPRDQIPFRLSGSGAVAAGLLFIFLTLSLPTFLLPTRTEKMLARAASEGLFPTRELLPLLRPPLVPNIRYPQDGDIAWYYEYPLTEENLMPMDARPMYYKIELLDRLMLRNPEKGLRGGFLPKANDG